MPNNVIKLLVYSSRSEEMIGPLHNATSGQKLNYVPLMIAFTQARTLQSFVFSMVLSLILFCLPFLHLFFIEHPPGFIKTGIIES